MQYKHIYNIFYSNLKCIKVKFLGFLFVWRYALLQSSMEVIFFAFFFLVIFYFALLGSKFSPLINDVSFSMRHLFPRKPAKTRASLSIWSINWEIYGHRGRRKLWLCPSMHQRVLNHLFLDLPLTSTFLTSYIWVMSLIFKLKFYYNMIKAVSLLLLFFFSWVLISYSIS